MLAQFASSQCSVREARAQTYCTRLLARLSAFRFRPSFAEFLVAIHMSRALCKHFAGPLGGSAHNRLPVQAAGRFPRALLQPVCPPGKTRGEAQPRCACVAVAVSGKLAIWP